MSVSLVEFSDAVAEIIAAEWVEQVAASSWLMGWW